MQENSQLMVCHANKNYILIFTLTVNGLVKGDVTRCVIVVIGLVTRCILIGLATRCVDAGT